MSLMIEFEAAVAAPVPKVKVCRRCNFQGAENLFVIRKNLCRKCRNVETRDWKRARKDVIKVKSADYYRRTQEQRLAYCKKWRDANPDIRKATHSRYYQENKEEIAVKTFFYQERTREDRMRQQRIYQRSPEGRLIGAASFHKRRARLKSVEVSVTTGEIKELFRRASVCCYCKQPFTDTATPSLDHKLPVKHGGAHALQNLAIACLPCNQRKGAKTPEQWEAWQLKVGLK